MFQDVYQFFILHWMVCFRKYFSLQLAKNTCRKYFLFQRSFMGLYTAPSVFPIVGSLSVPLYPWTWTKNSWPGFFNLYKPVQSAGSFFSELDIRLPEKRVWIRMKGALKTVDNCFKALGYNKSLWCHNWCILMVFLRFIFLWD